MKLILGTDSLHPPLTGIGRYTFELAAGLSTKEGVKDVLGFDFGRFHSMREALQRLDKDVQAAPEREGVVLRARRSLAKSVIATSVYQIHARYVCGPLLGRKKGYVFHSPNFHLPACKIPTVVTIHDLSFVFQPQYHPTARLHWMRRSVPFALKHADHVICVSQSTKADVVNAFNIAPERISVTPLGVSAVNATGGLEEAVAFERLGLRPGEYLLCVATIEPRKNVEGLVQAYLALPAQQRRAYPLVIAGAPGWKCEQTLSLLNRSREDGVRYLGYVPSSVLQSLYRGAMMFIYPSHYEGFGLPLLEAQAAGVPIISSNISSLPEVACSEALLVDPKCLSELSEAMAYGLESESWRQSCKIAGLRQAKSFTWERCVTETVAVYAQLGV